MTSTTSPFRVFVASPLSEAAKARLEGSGAKVTYASTAIGLGDPRLVDSAQDFEALVVLLSQEVDKHLLARMPALRIVASVSVGVDHIDLAACRAKGVVVTNTPGVLTEATADFAFGLLLAAARRIVEGDRVVRSGAFRGWDPASLVGVSVFGKTIGIVGLGRIGSAVARRARGFGMKLLYAQRHRLSEPMERALGARYVSTDELFKDADFVSLHCPLTDETRNVASRERLMSMKPKSVLVNASRGACVDEEALVHALVHGPLGGAGLDVYAHEPVVPEALTKLDNVVLTPHMASADRETREAMAELAVDNVLAVKDGRPPPSAVE